MVGSSTKFVFIASFFTIGVRRSDIKKLVEKIIRYMKFFSLPLVVTNATIVTCDVR